MTRFIVCLTFLVSAGVPANDSYPECTDELYESAAKHQQNYCLRAYPDRPFLAMEPDGECFLYCSGKPGTARYEQTMESIRNSKASGNQ